MPTTLKPIKTPCGEIVGVPAASVGVTAYKGIRYATANRWEYPHAVTHWDGIYRATQYGPNAMQDNAFVAEEKSGRSNFYFHEFREGIEYTYSEDCQYLNIWAPNNVQNAPVIVYIHGGAFLSGSGWDKAFEEPQWPHHGIIAVTLNYRLGPLGYACLPELTDEAGHTGNYGLYDQLCALQWISDNITSFGGNPNNITLMGQSAGAHSVQALITGNAAEGLVHRALMSSGCGDDSCLFHKERHMESRYSFWQAWKKATGAENLTKLRELPAKALYDALGKMFAEKGFNEVMANMGPIWDNALFPSDVLALQIPYLAGGNTQDMLTEMTVDALRWCQKQSVPSYTYCFSRQLPGDDKGAWHSADLWYWFGTLENCWRPFTTSDRLLSDIMIGYLVNFAKSGNPNGAGLPLWLPAHAGDVSAMCLDTPTPYMSPIVQEGTSGIFGW